MPLSREILEKRAVNAGVKASKKRHHLITEEELLSLRVQIMPALPRVLLGLGGLLLITAACFSWPFPGGAERTLEAIFGTLLLLFGIFGIRRTLEGVLDTYDCTDLIGSIIDGIVETVSNIDL